MRRRRLTTTTQGGARDLRNARAAGTMRAILIECLRTAFDQRSWHGANLLGSIRSVHATTAAQRLSGRRRTIWQQVLHAAYWKHVVVNKLAGTTRFPRRGSDWPHMPDKPDEAAWRADVELLKSTQQRLIEVVQSLPAKRLDDAKTRWLIHGAAAHDLYHAGQIKLLRKMLSEH
jgi:hypothetical protein